MFIGLIYDSFPVNLSISQFDSVVVLISELVSANHSLLAELPIPQFALAVGLSSDCSELSIPQSTLLILLNVSVSIRILLLLINEQIFYTLFDIFKYICDYSEGKQRVRLYIDIVKQASNIFDLDSAFTVSLINAVKKNKSWVIEKWSKNEVKELLAPFSCYIKADQIGKTRHDRALKTIIKHWGPKITSFFRSQNKSVKTLCQLANLSTNSFIYCDA